MGHGFQFANRNKITRKYPFITPSEQLGSVDAEVLPGRFRLQFGVHVSGTCPGQRKGDWMGRWKSLFDKRSMQSGISMEICFMMKIFDICPCFSKWYSHDIPASCCTQICPMLYPKISCNFSLWCHGDGDAADRWPAQAPQRIQTSRCIHPATGHWCGWFLHKVYKYIYIIHYCTFLLSWFCFVCCFMKRVSWPEHPHKENSESRGLAKLCSSLAASHGCGCGSFNTSTGLNSLALAIFTFGACRNHQKKNRTFGAAVGQSEVWADGFTFWRSNPCTADTESSLVWNPEMDCSWSWKEVLLLFVAGR